MLACFVVVVVGFFLCIAWCFSIIVWTPAVLSAFYACVLYCLYLPLFSTIEHVSHGKALWKYTHYYYYYTCIYILIHICYGTLHIFLYHAYHRHMRLTDVIAWLEATGGPPTEATGSFPVDPHCFRLCVAEWGQGSQQGEQALSLYKDICTCVGGWLCVNGCVWCVWVDGWVCVCVCVCVCVYLNTPHTHACTHTHTHPHPPPPTHTHTHMYMLSVGTWHTHAN